MEIKYLIGLAFVSLAVGATWNPPAKDEVELVANEKDKATGRIAVPPPNIPPIRNGGINQVPSPILNPVASPIVNTGAVGALIGGPVFYPPVRINIDPSSQLYIPPGAEGRITLLLKNDGVGDFFFISAMDDRAFPIQFDYPQIQMGPGQTVPVPGRIRVPQFANNVVDTITISVVRRSDSATSRRQVYIRTRSESGEKWAPWCTIRSVTRCEGYLDESLCANRFWNFRAEIRDSDSGLLSVSIKPDGRFLGEDFPVGINETVPVEQSVSCCTTGVDITALDVRGNTVHCRADQYSIYLSGGDIAAIVLGVILLIILIILIIFAVCRCCRRRKSITTAPIPRSKKDQA